MTAHAYTCIRVYTTWSEVSCPRMHLEDIHACLSHLVYRPHQFSGYRGVRKPWPRLGESKVCNDLPATLIAEKLYNNAVFGMCVSYPSILLHLLLASSTWAQTCTPASNSEGVIIPNTDLPTAGELIVIY